MLHHAIGVLLALPTWLGPLLFLPVANSQLERRGPPGLWRAWLAAAVAFVAFAVLGWYISPDTAGTPMATIASELILIAPSLAVTAFILQETRGSALPQRRRMAIAGLVGMGALLLCLMPAAIVSAALGGGEIGSPC